MSDTPTKSSFPQAIADTQSLMEQIATNQLSEAEIQQQISSLLSDKSGGRGFFATYLTSESRIADRPCGGVIDGLKSSIEVTTELLVKNLAMSSAMAVVHARNGDRDRLEGSQRVERRTKQLIRQIDLPAIATELQKLQQTITAENGEYSAFLDRWGYDPEQKRAIHTAISDALASQ